MDKTRLKLFSNFTSVPFDYLLISLVTNNVSNLGCLVHVFILDCIDRELHSHERLELNFGLSSEFFDKIPVRILLDVLFRLFKFSKASFVPWHLHSWHFKTLSPSLTLRHTEGCHGNFVILHVKLQIMAEILLQN